MHYKVGDRVRVMPPTNESTGVYTIEKFRGKVSTIKDVNVIRKGRSTLGISYTLEGCKTDWGLDYSFCEEWLVLANEEVAI